MRKDTVAGFLTTLEQAEEFFKRCLDKEAVTLPERLAILEQMQKERRVFAQSEKQLEARLNGKNVLRVKHTPRKKV